VNRANGRPSSPPTLELISIGELLAEPDEAVEFVIEGLIAKASVNVLSSKPKVGKSTLARALALAVARGDDFLGHRCPEIGTVWYIALEGSRGDIRKALRKLGATPDDPIRLFIGKAPQSIITLTRDGAVKDHPALIIIDTMQRFLRAKDTNDYAEMTLLFDHVIQIAQLSKAALLLLTHHAKIQRDGLDAILGSTAIAGSVDTAILLTRTDRYRSISTVQRTGEDLSETILRMDESGHVHLAGSRKLADQNHLRQQFITVLEQADGPIRRHELLEQVEGRKKEKLAALKDLVCGTSGTFGTRILTVTGKGTKSDPYLYSIRVPGFPHTSGNPNPSLLNGQQGLPLTPENGCSRTCTGPEQEREQPSGGNGDSDDVF
jgi:AAA domain